MVARMACMGPSCGIDSLISFIHCYHHCYYCYYHRCGAEYFFLHHHFIHDILLINVTSLHWLFSSSLLLDRAMKNGNHTLFLWICSRLNAECIYVIISNRKQNERSMDKFLRTANIISRKKKNKRNSEQLISLITIFVEHYFCRRNRERKKSVKKWCALTIDWWISARTSSKFCSQNLRFYDVKKRKVNRIKGNKICDENTRCHKHYAGTEKKPICVCHSHMKKIYLFKFKQNTFFFLQIFAYANEWREKRANALIITYSHMEKI